MSEYPPNVMPGQRVILFDGVCVLCNKWCQFIIKHDRQRHFTLASVQSDEGQRILRHYGFATDHFSTMLYVENNQLFVRSLAFFKIMAVLGYPYKSLSWLRVIPPVLSDWLYTKVANNRYVWFGKYEQCLLPTADHNQRFLTEQRQAEPQ